MMQNNLHTNNIFCDVMSPW